MFVSLGFFLLDADAMSLRYAIGGQPLPILLRSANGRPCLIDPPEHRLPLGAFRDVAYDTRELYLKKGDLLFFYTDGITEAMDSDMNPYGEERLMASLEARKAGGLEELAQGVWPTSGTSWGAEQYDDMTFLFLRVD
jgi:sigma-B regulation protein RsbU (phosphoserine phosphatase)